MNTSESADELVKICIDGVDKILRISGVAAKNIALMLIAMSKEKAQTSGKTRLTNMLRTGKPLDIFTIKASDLKKFSQEAKKYGILYCALANKKNNKIDGMVDIMVREEDGAKIDRISKRFNFKDVATIKQELDKEKEDKSKINEIDKEKSEDEQFLDDILPNEKEEQKDIPSNNTNETVEESQSETSSNTKLKDKMEKFKKEKNSVKKELEEIEQELKQKEDAELQNIQIDNTKTNSKKKQAKHYKEKETKQHKEKKQKNKGKRYKEPKHLDNTQKTRKTKNKLKGRNR